MEDLEQNDGDDGDEENEENEEDESARLKNNYLVYTHCHIWDVGTN